MKNKFVNSSALMEVPKINKRIFFALFCTAFFYMPTVFAQDAEPQPASDSTPAQTSDAALADWPMIEKEYKALRADRDNILAQVKAAYDEKNKALEALKSAEEKASTVDTERSELLKKIEAFEKEKMDIEDKISGYEQDNRDLSGQIESLQKLNLALTQENQEMLNQTSQHENSKVQAPKSLMEAVKNHQQLIRENADMHYNLGVLMSKNQDYKNATLEFQRAVQLRPNDASAYFNLGKIQADFYKDKVKAVEYFQKYLKLNPEAEDRGWVESFITTVKAWRAEEKLK